LRHPIIAPLPDKRTLKPTSLEAIGFIKALQLPLLICLLACGTWHRLGSTDPRKRVPPSLRHDATNFKTHCITRKMVGQQDESTYDVIVDILYLIHNDYS
jgi:hypothetical protein